MKLQGLSELSLFRQLNNIVSVSLVPIYVIRWRWGGGVQQSKQTFTAVWLTQIFFLLVTPFECDR